MNKNAVVHYEIKGFNPDDSKLRIEISEAFRNFNKKPKNNINWSFSESGVFLHLHHCKVTFMQLFFDDFKRLQLQNTYEMLRHDWEKEGLEKKELDFTEEEFLNDWEKCLQDYKYQNETEKDIIEMDVFLLKDNNWKNHYFLNGYDFDDFEKVLESIGVEIGERTPLKDFSYFYNMSIQSFRNQHGHSLESIEVDNVVDYLNLMDSREGYYGLYNPEKLSKEDYFIDNIYYTVNSQFGSVKTVRIPLREKLFFKNITSGMDILKYL